MEVPLRVLAQKRCTHAVRVAVVNAREPRKTALAAQKRRVVARRAVLKVVAKQRRFKHSIASVSRVFTCWGKLSRMIVQWSFW